MSEERCRALNERLLELCDESFPRGWLEGLGRDAVAHLLGCAACRGLLTKLRALATPASGVPPGARRAPASSPELRLLDHEDRVIADLDLGALTSAEAARWELDRRRLLERLPPTLPDQG